MKKLLLIILCLVFAFSGCQSLEKAEPFYSETGENIEFKTEYKYYFSDETNILCLWTNLTEENIFFHDTFQLHKLGDNGEWYVVGDLEKAKFKTDYSHFVEPGEEFTSNARYDITKFSAKLENGETYRISTYYFDESDNYYQIYAEFTCDNKLAEEEMLEISGGASDGRNTGFEEQIFEFYD
ncbi:MAG: hypothetical protein IKL57_01600 [Oscillospiraceae bacterium]|nr:hypothetical protein [Oscillospiraceae bacterium]